MVLEGGGDAVAQRGPAGELLQAFEGVAQTRDPTGCRYTRPMVTESPTEALESSDERLRQGLIDYRDLAGYSDLVRRASLRSMNRYR